MNGAESNTSANGSPAASDPSSLASLRWRQFVVYLIGLSLLFQGVLGDLYLLVRPSPLFSYIPMVPFVTLYLLHQRRSTLRLSPPAYGLAAGFIALGAILLAWGHGLPPATPDADRVAIGMSAYLALLLAGIAACFGAALLRTGFGPLLTLLFAIPLPDAAKFHLEILLQRASAEAAYRLLALTPVPIFREGLVFHLPRLSLEVAPECSGINSTWVLFMCSLIAGTLLLRSPWRRAILVAVVFPLGVLRNAVRILTIGLLTVYVDPTIIDGPLHHRGGPIFFALSLPVFIGILLLLWRSENRKRVDL